MGPPSPTQNPESPRVFFFTIARVSMPPHVSCSHFPPAFSWLGPAIAPTETFKRCAIGILVQLHIRWAIGTLVLCIYWKQMHHHMLNRLLHYGSLPPINTAPKYSPCKRHQSPYYVPDSALPSQMVPRKYNNSLLDSVEMLPRPYGVAKGKISSMNLKLVIKFICWTQVN